MEHQYRECDNQSRITLECDAAYWSVIREYQARYQPSGGPTGPALRLIPSLILGLILDLVSPSQFVLYMYGTWHSLCVVSHYAYDIAYIVAQWDLHSCYNIASIYKDIHECTYHLRYY